MTFTPEIITAWAGSIAAGIGVVGVALQKAGWLTLHSRKQKPNLQKPTTTQPMCPVSGEPCKDHPLIEKRVDDLEQKVADLIILLAKISTDVSYIRGKLDSK